MAIRLIMFNSGLQVIGSVEDKNENAKSVVVSKPVQLLMTPSDDPSKAGQLKLGFSPFLQYTVEWEKGITFMVSDILTVVTPLRDLENGYTYTFGSGLVLPAGIGSGR